LREVIFDTFWELRIEQNSVSALLVATLLKKKICADSAMPPLAVAIEPMRRPLLTTSLILLNAMLPSVTARFEPEVALL